jgi:hypothetical protein
MRREFRFQVLLFVVAAVVSFASVAPAAGRLMVAPASGGTPTEVLDPESETAVVALAFQEDGDLMFVEHEGVETRLAVLEPNRDPLIMVAHGASADLGGMAR